MNVPNGYKMTEVGLIPEDWEVKKLGDLLDYEQPTSYLVKNTKYSNSSSIPVLTAGKTFILGYTDENFGVFQDLPVIIFDDFTTASRFIDFPFKVKSSAMKMLKARSNEVNLRLVYELMQLIDFTVADHKRHWISEYQNFEIAIPDSQEQRSIARVLSDTDELINALDKLIAKKRDIKKAVMQELLTGKTRLPGFSGEWEVKKLGDIAEMASGGTPLTSNPNYYNGDIPWVSISDMTKGGKHIFATDKYITQLGFNNSACKIFPIGTVLYAMYASLGECSIAGIPLCSSQAILGIRVKENLDNEFLYYYLNYIKNTVKGYGQQGTQPNLNKEIVQNFQIKLPFIDEQRSIAQVLSDMDREITALEQRRDKTKALKQGMMQALLTGRIRLPKGDTNDA